MMGVRGAWAIVFAAVCISAAPAQADPCDVPGVCCVDPATCFITDKETLAGLTVDQTISCPFTLASWVSGGGATGVAPQVGDMCGLSFSLTGESAASAINSLDHHWLQSTDAPKVVDFGAPVNTVFVFVAVDHEPFPEEGIESTVWGSNSPSVVGFPSGWTPATLTTIWKQGWEEPAACEPGDNADDFPGQYSFPGGGFQYIAVHADFSISIFNDPSHTTWTAAGDDSSVTGWQSHDDEIDAVGTPLCEAGAVVADAGADQTAGVGEIVCFDGSGSTAAAGIATIGWDTDGDTVVDVTGETACITCSAAGEGDVSLFVTDSCGCVDSDTAHFTCVEETGCTLTQGYWKNHHAGARNPSQDIPWPIPETTMLCGQTWLQILETPPKGNAWYILAHQWIAASLNVANGASTPPAVDDALADGAALLAGCSISSADRAAAVAIAGILDDYNNGLTGPGHCDDDGGSSGREGAARDGASAGGCAVGADAGREGGVLLLLLAVGAVVLGFRRKLRR